MLPFRKFLVGTGVSLQLFQFRTTFAFVAIMNCDRIADWVTGLTITAKLPRLPLPSLAEMDVEVSLPFSKKNARAGSASAAG